MYNLHKKEKIIKKHEQRTNKTKFQKNVNLFNIKNNKSLEEINHEIQVLSIKKTKKYISHLYFIYYYLINYLLVEYIILSLPNLALSLPNYSITLYLGEIGDQQIFNDNYNISSNYPSRVYVNNEIQILRDKNILLEDIKHIIKLEWNEPYPNLSYMFANLSTITSAKFTSPSMGNLNISYMFYNCTNLKGFSYSGKAQNQIIDATKMFYNCKSLLSANFSGYKKDFATINSSYMFFQCEKLSYIYFANLIKLNDMRKMFYNCNSLTSINFTNFMSEYSINTSYLFYNCYSLDIFINNSIQIIKTEDMKYMFYNCSQLEDIDLTNFEIANSANLSYAFYNCKKLTNIQLNKNSFFPSDMQNMFYNCSSLISINLPQYKNDKPINMTRMFYNCYKVQSIDFETDSLFYPNDLHATFYNCTSLSRLDIKNKFITDNVIDMSYLFYNCSGLSTLDLNFSNLLTKNMRGTFQNCKLLTTLELSNFYTPNAEIMWDMFRGCSSIKSLDLKSFDTSKVTDMESMFEECSSFSTLSLNSFQTPNVQYMNKMFKNCNSLKSLDFRNIITTSCGTMHQMFYNCKSLTYLNLYNITERGQSIAEMFDKASTNFKFCIKENENIPNIFNVLLNMTKTKRDCSTNCYENAREEVKEKKLCCRYARYKDNCYDKCPSKTHYEQSKKYCINFTCPNNTYYNYEQNDCTDNISGYYVNDSVSRTIDKCHEDCLECNGAPSNVSTNCKKCNDSKPYIYLGNCYQNCTPGFYEEDPSICKCFDRKCKLCNEDSLKYDLCETCNDDYYPKENEITNKSKWINCYHEPENYFLKETSNPQVYSQCYPSCKYCSGKGDHNFHL